MDTSSSETWKLWILCVSYQLEETFPTRRTRSAENWWSNVRWYWGDIRPANGFSANDAFSEWSGELTTNIPSRHMGSHLWICYPFWSRWSRTHDGQRKACMLFRSNALLECESFSMGVFYSNHNTDDHSCMWHKIKWMATSLDLLLQAKDVWRAEA